jgi:hypothetical protein
VPTVGPNTLYSENGWPTFESPIAASRNLIDLLLQDGDGTLSVSRGALGVAGREFHDFRAQGGFMISAVRKNARTEWIRIKSLAGEPCVVRADFPEEIKQAGPRAVPLRQHDGVIELALKAGEEVVLYAGARPKSLRCTAARVEGPGQRLGAKAAPAR